MNAQSLEEQRMRRQQDQDLYARSDAPPQTRETQTPEAPGPPTVLVFRDQHKLEVQNYAIVGQTLWNFTGRRTQKIALAELDLAATAKANDERGVTSKCREQPKVSKSYWTHAVAQKRIAGLCPAGKPRACLSLSKGPAVPHMSILWITVPSSLAFPVRMAHNVKSY